MIIDRWKSSSIFHKSNHEEEDDAIAVIFLSIKNKNKK
jgi:hypothetical protein